MNSDRDWDGVGPMSSEKAISEAQRYAELTALLFSKAYRSDVQEAFADAMFGDDWQWLAKYFLDADGTRFLAALRHNVSERLRKLADSKARLERAP